MKLAIIIPFYKLLFFEQTLVSLVSQTDKRFKVYIGDDASPEDCLPLIEKYSEQLDIAYHRFEVNRGSTSLVAHWERCIARINEEDWMMILGDDDTLEKNCIGAFYNYIENSSMSLNTVIRFATREISADNKLLTSVFYHPDSEPSTNFLIRKLKKHTRSSLSEYIFSTKKYIEYKFKDFPLAWSSDDLAFLEFSDFGTISTLNEAIANIRVSDLSISGRDDNSKLKEKASYEFYSLLLSKYHDKFTYSEREKIIQKIEAIFFKNKKLKTFTQLTGFHLNYISPLSYFKFLRRIIINYKN